LSADGTRYAGRERHSRRAVEERKSMSNYIQVVTTSESKVDAEQIAWTLVEARLAACVQIVGPITSTYRWKGETETAEEWQCVAKSREDLFAEIDAAIRGLHPYEVPEILAVPVVAGSSAYLEWLEGELKGR
jgi:periplasmic divalent cation tolerance protein